MPLVSVFFRNGESLRTELEFDVVPVVGEDVFLASTAATSFRVAETWHAQSPGEQRVCYYCMLEQSEVAPPIWMRSDPPPGGRR